MTSADTSKTSYKRRTVLGLAMAGAVAAVVLATAQAAVADPVDLRVVDRDFGQPLATWRYDGRLFVAGRPGARYSLRVSNNTGARVLVVLSVDGVNILTGETAGYDQRGYIFKPHETYDLSGWRRSETQIAAFTFSALSNSYAARTGRPGDVGVIGMAVFNERVRPPIPVSRPPSVSANSADAARAGAGRGGALAAPMPAPAPQSSAAGKAVGSPIQSMDREESLGTGYGDIERSVITVLPFERATAYPQFTSQVEYDTYDNLVAKGVIPTSQSSGRQPRPFPNQGYVPDPPR